MEILIKATPEEVKELITGKCDCAEQTSKIANNNIPIAEVSTTKVLAEYILAIADRLLEEGDSLDKRAKGT